MCFYKDSERRGQSRIYLNYAEMPLIFYKDNSFLCISDISGEDFKNK